jgi:hypothetical protein
LIAEHAREMRSEMFTEHELDLALREVKRAIEVGAPYTWRSSNLQHRRLLELERRGKVRRAKVERARIWWGLP